MSSWHDIKYFGFWDQPRTFFTLGGLHSYLFDCPFNERLDAYPENYNVYEIPHSVQSDLPVLWENLANGNLHFLGTVVLPLSVFDQSRRKQVDLDVLSKVVRAEGARDA